MNFELSPEQKASQARFRAFVDEQIAPHAEQFDRDERIPDQLIRALGERGWLVSTPGLDAITQGLLWEEVGRGSASVQNLLTCATMVACALMRCGTPAQKEAWLPGLASGEIVGAYGLTEPGGGSDASHNSTSATRDGEYYILEGQKRWISFGQRADLFLIFAQCEGKPTAFLLERATPGFSVEPITGLLGLRGSMLGELHLGGCRVPEQNRLGQEGMGFSWVAATSLDQGRYCTACGSVGLAQACLDACRRYTRERRQFGQLLKDHQLVQRMLTTMIANVSAARLLCQRAGYLREKGDPEAIQANLVAKYFASTTAFQVAGDAVQIHGANGVGSEYPVQRYLRDAKIMEIIEGTTQIHQIKVAQGL